MTLSPEALEGREVPGVLSTAAVLRAFQEDYDLAAYLRDQAARVAVCVVAATPPEHAPPPPAPYRPMAPAAPPPKYDTLILIAPVQSAPAALDPDDILPRKNARAV